MAEIVRHLLKSIIIIIIIVISLLLLLLFKIPFCILCIYYFILVCNLLCSIEYIFSSRL